MTRLSKWIVTAALFAVAVAVPVWLMGSAMVRPTPSAVAPASPPAQDFTLTASDGLTVAATYWPGRTPNAPGVLLLHGNGGSRGQMAEHAAWLAAQGYAAMTIDFRGHGESASATHSFGLFESRDAAAAADWLRRRQRGGKIAAIGVSLGGAASLLGDNGPINTDALVLQAVYPDIRRAIRNRFASVMGSVPGWLIEPMLSVQALPRYGVWPSRIAPVTALRTYRGAVFVIGGGEDRYTPPAETREMFAAALGPKSLWLVDGLDHAGVSGMDTPLYRARILGFLGGAIGRP
jgi:pimeloyl-ACP methyl ester carboxylesterase